MTDTLTCPSQVSLTTLMTDLQVWLFDCVLVRLTSLTLSLPPVLPLFPLANLQMRKSGKNPKKKMDSFSRQEFIYASAVNVEAWNQTKNRGQQQKKHSASTCFSFFPAVFTQSSNVCDRGGFLEIKSISGKMHSGKCQLTEVFSIFWSLLFDTQVGIIFLILSSTFPSWKAASALVLISLCTSSPRPRSTKIMTWTTPPSCPAPTSCFKIHQIMGTLLKMQNHCGWSLTDKRVILRPASPHNMTCHASLFFFPP